MNVFCTINEEHSYAVGLHRAADGLGPGKQRCHKKTKMPPCLWAIVSPPFPRGPLCAWSLLG